jgi:hypothetical protein
MTKAKVPGSSLRGLTENATVGRAIGHMTCTLNSLDHLDKICPELKQNIAALRFGLKTMQNRVRLAIAKKKGEV